MVSAFGDVLAMTYRPAAYIGAILLGLLIGYAIEYIKNRFKECARKRKEMNERIDSLIYRDRGQR